MICVYIILVKDRINEIQVIGFRVPICASVNDLRNTPNINSTFDKKNCVLCIHILRFNKFTISKKWSLLKRQNDLLVEEHWLLYFKISHWYFLFIAFHLKMLLNWYIYLSKVIVIRYFRHRIPYYFFLVHILLSNNTSYVEW